ncbi:MAG: SufE family protein [Robiginitomaculum sp.]
MNIRQNIQDLIDDFSFLEDWEDRYIHVIELGKALPDFTDAEKTTQNKVNGCVSQVWLIAETANSNPHIINYRGDSDAHIVKGLIAIVLTIFSGLTANEIQNIDANSIIGEIGLAEHLSAQRANGLNAMIDRIKKNASTSL